MKAIRFQQYGRPEVLRYEECDRPRPRPGEVLIEVKAAALNPIDAEVRKGRMRILTGRRFPRGLGSDMAGTVVEVGSRVQQVKVGEQVYGMLDDLFGASYAEYAVSTVRRIATMPKDLSFIEAASLPLVSLTCLQALRDHGHLKEGMEVFINGCSGGVGTAGIQIANILGGRVTGSCSGRNIALCRSLGAAELVDYTRKDILDTDKQYDIFYDVYGNKSFARVKHMLKPNGVYVTTIPHPLHFLTAFASRLWPGKKAAVVVVKARRQDLELLRSWVEAGTLKPVVDRTYPLAEAADAHTYLETRRARGKVVLITGKHPQA
jgi:NADPH:quinone reductase-like Zn-dependent oxidoreductase